MQFELKVKPILDSKVAEYVMREAKDNKHYLLQPTHSVEKDSVLIGAFNLAKLPVVNFWMHTERAHSRDCLIAFNVAENLLRAQGNDILILMHKPNSPFNNFIPKLDYKSLDTNISLSFKLL